jgi:hypothetical protein
MHHLGARRVERYGKRGHGALDSLRTHYRLFVEIWYGRLFGKGIVRYNVGSVNINRKNICSLSPFGIYTD